MEQRENTNDAALKVVQINPYEEEYAASMGQSVCDAAAKDAQTKSSMEEYALSMEQRRRTAALKDAQIIPNEEEYAGDMVHTATIKMHLLLSHRVSVQILIRLL